MYVTMAISTVLLQDDHLWPSGCNASKKQDYFTTQETASTG